MQEVLSQIYSYLWGIWRYRWLALVVAWVIALGGWLVVWKMPDAYVATARIYVDTSSVLRPLLKGLAIQPNINERVDMMTRTMLSRPNLEKLMRMTDLDLEISTEEEKEDMLEDLADAITLEGERRNASLYSVGVQHHDRDLAKRLVQALITVFIENSLSDKRADSSDAQDFLDNQIAEYEKRMVQAEDRVAKFKQANFDVLGGDEGYYSRLQLANTDLEEAELLLSEMMNRKQELERQLAGEEPFFMSSGIATPESMTPLDRRIQALKAQLDGLLSRYTDKHPEARQIQSMIADLEDEKRQAYGQVRRAGGSVSPSMANSPVYLEMRSSLAETNAELAELQVRVVEYKRRAEELAHKVNIIPEVEAQLKQLDRDYEVVVKQHQQLMGRRESARLSGDVEQNANDVNFRVVEPPYVPSKPSEPNKILLNIAVLVLAMGGGAGIALLCVLISPVITNSRSLEDITGMPVLGVVPLNMSQEQKKAEHISMALYSSLGLVLVLVCAGITVGYQMRLA
jgi:protein tyrosine kinase modulator